MGRIDDIKVLYRTPRKTTMMEEFDNLMKPCHLLQVLSIEDIYELNRIAKDNGLSSKPKEKMDMIKQIMMRRGFKKLAAGTNRIVFKFMENQSFVIKVAFDSVGLSDNTNEWYNQELLKPFCTKVFEVSPCGTVGMFERVHTISSRKEFSSVASNVYDTIVNAFVGKYVLDDFGSKFFMNWGVRNNTYPVILDFPYVYELDGAKIHCNKPDDYTATGFCGGEIDYDDGFNHLICTKCGKRYLASDLKMALEKKSNNMTIEREDLNMIITLTKGNTVIYKTDTNNTSDLYRRDKNGRIKETPYEYRQRKKKGQFRCTITRGNVEITSENQGEQYSVEDIQTQSNVSRILNVSITTKDGKPVYSKDGSNVVETEQEAVTRIEEVLDAVSSIVDDSTTEKDKVEEEPMVEETKPGMNYQFRTTESQVVEEDENKTVIEGDVSAKDILEIVPRPEPLTARDILFIISRDESTIVQNEETTPSEFY